MIPWLEATLSGKETVAWSVLLAFLRLTTRAGIFQKPLTPEAAFDPVEPGWLSRGLNARLRVREFFNRPKAQPICGTWLGR